MLEIKSYIEKFNRITLIWLILFSLFPCIVKEGMFNWIDIEYSKPLNKSKTTAQTRLCQYSPHNIQHISFEKKSKFNKQIEPTDFFGQPFFIARATKVYGNDSKTFSGNSPPKYILYKRLKIAIA